jgi:hypothetical protein
MRGEALVEVEDDRAVFDVPELRGDAGSGVSRWPGTSWSCRTRTRKPALLVARLPYGSSQANRRGAWKCRLCWLSPT